MKLQIAKHIIEKLDASERDERFKQIIESKRNKTITMHRDYYEGNHWLVRNNEDRTGTTRSGKHVFGKAPNKIPLKGDKLDRKNDYSAKEIQYHAGQLQKRNYIKFFIQFYQDFITGTDEEEIQVVYEREVKEDFTKDENNVSSNPQDSDNVTEEEALVNRSVNNLDNEGNEADQEDDNSEEINKVLKSLWKTPEQFVKTQVARMTASTIAVGALEYDADEEQYFVSIVDAREIVPIYKRDQRIGTLRTYMIDKEECEAVFDMKIDEGKDKASYAEIYYKEKDEVYFIKFVDGKPYFGDIEAPEGNVQAIKVTDKKQKFDPYDMVPNIKHAFRRFDEKELEDSEIFEWIDQNDSLNAQNTIEHISSLFIAQPKTSIDWDVAEKMQLDTESEEFKQAIHEFDWLPNSIDNIPVKVLDAKGIPESFYKSKDEKKQNLFEDAGVPMIIASGQIPSNLGVETLQLSNNRLNLKISQKREPIANLIKKISLKMLYAKGLISGEEIDEIKNIKVIFPSNNNFTKEKFLDYLFMAVDKGLLPDEYATLIYLEVVGKQEDSERVIASRNSSLQALKSLIDREKNADRKIKLAQEGVINRDQNRANNATNPDQANQFLNNGNGGNGSQNGNQ